MAEIYGTTYFETGKDKIVALLNALVTSMETDYDPALSYVYEKHNTALLRLNAATIDFEEAEEEMQTANDYNVRYLIAYSIRVHTAYTGGIKDGQKNMRLINSIINKLKANLNLADGYRIEQINGISNNEEFEGSETYGGQLNVIISYSTTHTQE